MKRFPTPDGLPGLGRVVCVRKSKGNAEGHDFKLANDPKGGVGSWSIEARHDIETAPGQGRKQDEKLVTPEIEAIASRD